MKRSEFLDEVNGFYELIDFCNEHGLDLCDGIVAKSEIDAMIFEDIQDSSSRLYWYQVRDRLADIPEDYDWYIRNGDFDYEGFDDDDDRFLEIKENVLDECDSYDDFWDPEDDEEDECAGEDADDTYWGWKCGRFCRQPARRVQRTAARAGRSAH